MKDQYIKYDVFNLLKKTDFQFKTKFLKFGSKPSSLGSLFDSPIFKKITPKPTQSLVQKWLRDTKKILVEINCVCVGDQNIIQYKYTIIHHWKEGNHLKELAKDYWFDSYEEALEKGLIEALKLI